MREVLKKKILIVIPNLGKGGAQKIFHQQMEHLSSCFEVIGCVFNWDGAFEHDRAENIISLDVPKGEIIPSKVWNFILRIWRLRKLKKKFGIQVTISHLEGADYVNVLSRSEDEVICWVHGTKKYDENIEGSLGLVRKKFLIPMLYAKASQLVTVSKGIKDELIRDYPNLKSKLTTIYNGFEVQNIIDKKTEPLSQEFMFLFKESKVILTHCRLSRQKNLKPLLKIFSDLPKTYKTKLVIVGDGELRDEILSFCSDINLKYWSIWDNLPIQYDKDVYFLGQQANPYKFLAHSSVYVMTSGWEGFPLALCEALACDLPVICSDCFTGPREIIAADIVLAQPVKEAYYTSYGVLMPLVSLDDNVSLGIWNEVIVNALGSKIPIHTKSAGLKRIREFEISNSIDQTIKLIHNIAP